VINAFIVRVWVFSLALLVLPQISRAQDPPPQPPTTAPVEAAENEAKPDRGFFSSLMHNLGDDVKHMPRKNSLYWLAAGSAAALAIHPADEEINARMQGSGFADNFFIPGKFIGSSYTIGAAAVTTYLVGRHIHSDRGKHLGMDLMESTILSEAITQLVKVAVRRERPIAPDGTQASGYSFPSGHATVTFAAATVLQQHLGWKAAVPTYLVASYVAMSRLHDSRHWASDVMFGAADGIIIGRSVTWHGRNYYASPMLVPKGAGVMVSLQP
jgi:membrane-associated phospholipid phosphatase